MEHQTTPPWMGCKIFIQSTASLISEFLFSLTSCRTKAKSSVCPTISFIAKWVGRRDEFMLFSRALAWNEMQTALPRIRTRVTKSISYSDNITP